MWSLERTPSPSQGSPCKHLGEKGVRERAGVVGKIWNAAVNHVEDMEDIFFGTASITSNDGIIIFSGSNSARKPFAIWIYIIPSWNSTPTETGGMYWACSFWPYDHMALAKNGISQFRYQSNHHIPMFSWPRGVYVSYGCDAKSRWTFPQRIRASARSFGPTPAFRPSGLAALPGTSSCSLGMLLGYFGMLSWDVKLGY